MRPSCVTFRPDGDLWLSPRRGNSWDEEETSVATHVRSDMLLLPSTYKKPTNNFHGHCFARNTLSPSTKASVCPHCGVRGSGPKVFHVGDHHTQTRPGFGAVMIPRVQVRRSRTRGLGQRKGSSASDGSCGGHGGERCADLISKWLEVSLLKKRHCLSAGDTCPSHIMRSRLKCFELGCV